MKNAIHVGDVVAYRHVVREDDVAMFHGMVVHPVYSTFALARDVEWTTRQLILKIIEEDEEGIGTQLTIEHKSPAFVGEEVVFSACVSRFDGNELICSFKAMVGERLIASGTTGQKVLKRKNINKLFRIE